MDSVYHSAAAAAREGQTAALVVVTSAKGHTPQVVGARMLVLADGRIEGTVGGGRFEHEVTRRAVSIAAGHRAELLTLRLGAELGMCCGGVMEVLITPVTTADGWLEQACLAMASGKERWLRTSLGPATLGQRTLSDRPGEPEGDRRFEGAGLEGSGPRTLLERLGAPARLLLFGAGHVSQPTARIGTMLGYRVVVIDDRADWNTPGRFPTASERVLVPYEDFLDSLNTRPSDAAVIVTRGHDFDQLILEALIDTNVAYLGMIGSRSKVHKAFLKLRAAGVPEDRIARVAAPLGLDIGALTPEEIGVAIGAQLVEHRRRPRSGEAA